MGKKGDVKTGTVKKETLLVAVGIAFAAGFLGGVIFGVYKSPSGLPAHVGRSPQQALDSPGPSPGTAAKIRSLETEASRHPENAAGWIRLGDVYFDANAFEKAIGAYRKALELNPNDADVLTDLGIMYRRSGNPARALASFDRAAAADPRHEASRFNKGVVLLHDLKDPRGALDAWKDLVAINPKAATPGGQLVGDLIQKIGAGAGKQ